MFLKSQSSSTKFVFILLVVSLGVVLFVHSFCSYDSPVEEKSPELPATIKKPEFVKGIHLTAWVTGSKKLRERIEPLFKETELNTVVVAIKEYQGEVYIPGVPLAEKHKLFVNAIPDIKEYLAQLKEKGVYTIARIVVFKDNALARKRNDLAVKKSDGSLWQDRRKNSWTDPYNKEVWDYNISVATQAVALGFQEIQFDYIRYPSDGNIKQCVYSYAHHTASSAAKNLDAFLEFAYNRLKPLGINISIDVFGLTTTVFHDMGIGQKIGGMTNAVDYVSPMVYPSHYAKGEYGIPDPNREPYKVVYKSISTAKERLGKDFIKLRPYLQDFSLGYKYGPKEVRAQIQACEDAGVQEWLLWSPNCNYTSQALKSKVGVLPSVAQLPKSMTEKLPETRKEGGKKTHSPHELNSETSSQTAVSPSERQVPPEQSLHKSSPSTSPSQTK